jgi:serine/threonine protein kinase
MSIPFGRYELLKKLAAGGMGQVFLARRKGVGFEKLVVLKRILPHLVEDEEFFTMFLDEARLTARLNHPNIAQIFDVEAEAGQHLVVMEYVAGEDVRRLEKKARQSGSKIPLGAILRIIADASAGLDYAHKARDEQGNPMGLVHRDISPQNVLVGFDGGVKLIDFGVAKAAGRAQHTTTGVLKGKFPYMSPEQAEGEELDGRSDIFALGIVMWELLCDKRLFKGDNDMMSQRLVKQCQVPPPSSIDKKLPKQLDAIVLKALAKNRDDRYEDANALRLAIEEYVMATSTPASSAHLAAYMQKLYAEQIERQRDPANLDELGPDSNLEGFSGGPMATPAPGRSRSRSQPSGTRSGVKTGGAAQMSQDAFDAAGPTVKARTRSQAGEAKSSVAAPLIIAALALALGGVGVWAYLTQIKPPQAAVQPPVPEVKPPPVKPVEAAPAGGGETPPPVVQPAQLAFRVQSEPPGAEVEYGGRRLGLTPLEVLLLRSELPAVLKVSRDGFEPQSTTVTEDSGPQLSLQLTKKRKSGGNNRPDLGIKTGR